MILRRALLVPTGRRETGVWIAVSGFQKRDNIHRANGILPGFLPGIDAGNDSVLQIMLGCFLGNLAQPVELLLVDDLRVGIQYPLVVIGLFRHLIHHPVFDRQRQTVMGRKFSPFLS